MLTGVWICADRCMDLCVIDKYVNILITNRKRDSFMAEVYVYVREGVRICAGDLNI